MLTIEKAVEIYQIHRTENNDRIFLNRSVTENQEHFDFVRSHKTEIVDYLKEHEESMKREAEEQQAKLNALEGLRELEDASIAWKEYYIAYRRFIEDDAEGKAPKKPEASLEELVRKYPRANAYMKAESYAYSSSNNARAAAGKKALERILNGEDYKQAITDMKKEWRDYCEEHVFDN